MAPRLFIRFADDAHNRELTALLKTHGIEHSVDRQGSIRYSSDDEEVVENELVRSIRDRIFSPWQVLSCPDDWGERYKHYMSLHGIPFREEWIDGQACFLLPRKYRPQRWKLEAEPALAAGR